MFSIRTILHATDFSETSDAAFRCAYSLAADYHAQLVIVHVASVPVMVGESLSFFCTEECQEKLKEELDELEIPDEHVNVVRRLEQGRPAAEILHLAQLCQADLIVMGSHGRRGLQRFVMGSVADEVVRQATCPVLTVRACAWQGKTLLGNHARSVASWRSKPEV